jgi:hypothetical protein
MDDIFIYTIFRKFRLRLTIHLVCYSKQINKQTYEHTFLSINYNPILQHNTTSPNGMDTENERHRQSVYRNLSFVKQLIHANRKHSTYIKINAHIYQRLS